MGNTIEFIKNNAPTLGLHLESLVDKDYTYYDEFLKANYLTHAFLWDTSDLGHYLCNYINEASDKELQTLEAVYLKNKDGEYPRNMIHDDGKIVTVYAYVNTINHYVVKYNGATNYTLCHKSVLEEIPPLSTSEQIAERAGITVEELYNIVKREIAQ